MKSSLLVLLALGASAAAETERDIYCGGRCLFVALCALDIPVESYDELESRLGTPHPQGYSMLDLASAAEQLGAHTLAVETTLENLVRRSQRFACIAHVRANHFVLFSDVRDGFVTVVDGIQKQQVAASACEAFWSGEVLLIADRELVPESDLRASRRPTLWIVLTVVLLSLSGVLWWRRR